MLTIYKACHNDCFLRMYEILASPKHNIYIFFGEKLDYIFIYWLNNFFRLTFFNRMVYFFNLIYSFKIIN